MGAPVCHVPGTENIEQPDARKQPSIPIATDLASALAAINALRQIVMQLAGQLGSLGKFKEQKRVTQKVRIYNPHDKTQYVDVEQINQLVLKDVRTGQTWTYQR